MNILVNAFLVFLGVSGFTITFSSSWSSVYRALLLLHPALGVLTGLLFLPYIRAHARARSKEAAPFYHRLAVFLGQLSFILFLALFITGIFMLPGAAHNTRLILWHRTAGFLFAAFFILHVTRLLFVRENVALVFSRLRRFILPVSAASILLLFFYQWKMNIRPENLRVIIPSSLEGKPLQKLDDIFQMTQTQSCGSVPACHRDIVKHYKHSNHFRSPQSPHFKKIVALLKKERGKESARFCFSCHAPHLAVSALSTVPEIKENTPGMSCMACHALHEAQLVPFGKHGKKGFSNHGYTMRFNTAHLSMFKRTDKKGRLTPMNEYLIRLNPLGHGRVLMTNFMKTDAFCLSCHQEHIPPLAKEDVVRPNCTYCHMQLQLSFVKGKHIVKKAHYFAGANIITPRVLGDKEGYSVVRGWLTGYFKTETLDSYWELRKAAGEPPEKATWLVMTMEPVNPPSPGKPCKIKIFTSNPGIGHPFPTGVIDMYDVWMRFRVTDEAENVIYENGKAGGRPFEKTNTHWLGGYFYDKDGKPILRHRVWEKKGAVRKWVEPGKTIEDVFMFTVPESAKGQKYITVEAEWNYGRLNHDFALWAYGSDKDFPPVPMVSVKQRIPVEPGL